MLKIRILIISLLAASTVNTLDISEYSALVKNLSASEVFRAAFQVHLKYAQSLDANYPDYKPEAQFTCDTSDTSPQVPDSVHELRPSDVKVVAALGDSYTAGLGAKARTVIGLLTEYRAVSWSIGGQNDVSKVVTFANILKKFSPKLTGFSDKTTEVYADHERLNVAVSGAVAKDITSQARNLVKLMKADKAVDFAHDWKVVTVFIGGNDLCDICVDTVSHRPEQYVKDIQDGLDVLHAEMPRTLVNLVSMFRVNDMKDLNRGLFCATLHKSECKCASYPANQQAEDLLVEYTRNYTVLESELASSGRYDTKEDFTVVLQPYYTDFNPPRLANGQVDISYFAPDCFHPSAKAHAYAGVGLWNNMLEPVGKKSTTMVPGEPIRCPTKESPYLFTNKNSN